MAATASVCEKQRLKDAMPQTEKELQATLGVHACSCCTRPESATQPDVRSFLVACPSMWFWFPVSRVRYGKICFDGRFVRQGLLTARYPWCPTVY